MFSGTYTFSEFFSAFVHNFYMLQNNLFLKKVLALS